MEARQRLVELPGAIRNVILLTDGHNESESRRALEAAVARCDGVFQCDCRGIGTDWRVDELRYIASRLLGSVDIIAAVEDMPADFAAMTARAMAKRTADVTFRLVDATRGGDRVRQAGVTDRSRTSPGACGATSTSAPSSSRPDRGAAEERDYHIRLVVPDPGGGRRDARRPDQRGRSTARSMSRSPIRAVWTDDHAASTR